MRLSSLLLLLLFPLYLLAQADTTGKTLRKQHNYRIGFNFSRDRTPVNHLTMYQTIFVGVPKRSVLPELHITRRIPVKHPMLLLNAQLQVSYQPIDYSGGRDARINPPPSRMPIVPGFTEEIIHNSWQFGLGLEMEPIAQAMFSPYLRLTYLLSVPTRLHYELGQAGGGIDLPGYRLVEGGAQVSPGWMIETGMRIHLHPHICFKIGTYYIDQSLRVDWPTFEGRNFTGTVMRLHNTGWNAGMYYCW